jgi:hypothetical protein
MLELFVMRSTLSYSSRCSFERISGFSPSLGDQNRRSGAPSEPIKKQLEFKIMYKEAAIIVWKYKRILLRGGFLCLERLKVKPLKALQAVQELDDSILLSFA